MATALLEFGISIADELIGALLDLVVARRREQIRQRKYAEEKWQRVASARVELRASLGATPLVRQCSVDHGT